MKEKIYTILGFMTLLFIIAFRSHYYSKIFSILDERDSITKSNIENVMFEEISEKLYCAKIEGLHIMNENLENAILNEDKNKILNIILEKKKQSDNIDDIYIVLENGQTYSTSSVRNADKGYNKEEWYLKAARKNNISLTGGTNSDGTPTCYISYPITLNGEFTGIYNISLNIKIFDSLIANTLDGAKQVFIKDDDGNVFYKMSPDYNIKKSDEHNVYTNENSKIITNSFSFTVETYYNAFYKNRRLILIDMIFSIIFILCIVAGIKAVFNSKSKTIITKIAIQSLIILLIEWVFVLSLMINEYDKCLQKHLNAIENFKTELTQNLENVGDLLYNNLREYGLDNFVKNNDYNLNDNLYEPLKLTQAFINNKTNCEFFVNAFYVGEDGKYIVYPTCDATDIRDLNFKYLRAIAYNDKLDEGTSLVEFNNNVLFTKYYKIKDENNNSKGIAGINVKCIRLVDALNYILNDGKGENVFKIMTNGDVYSEKYDTLFEYIDGKKYTNKFKFKFTSEKVDKLLKQKNGWMKEDSKVDTIRYLFFTDVTDEDKYIVKIDIDKKNSTAGMSYMSFFVIITAGLMIYSAARIIFKNSQKYIDGEYEIRKSISKKIGPKEMKEGISDPVLNERLKIFNKNIK